MKPQGKVLAEFMRSTARCQMIMGPLGSAKTFQCCQKNFALMNQQAPDRQGVRKTRWYAIRNCFDDKTEILTERDGWVLFKDLDDNQKVASLVDGHLEFVTPTYYYSAPYVGEMVGYHSETIDFCVTPNHRMYVSKTETRKKVWSDYRFELAMDIEKKTGYRVKRNAEWKGENQNLSVDFFEWLGFFFAEGHIGTTTGKDNGVRKRLIITQCKPDGIDYTRNLFIRAGIVFTESHRGDGGINFRVSTKTWDREHAGNRLFRLLEHVGKATTKAVPVWIKQGTSEQLMAFINGFINGDGTRRANSVVAYTSSVTLADDLQEMALKAGMVANINSRNRVGNVGEINGASYTVNAIEHTVSFLKNRGIEPMLLPSQYRREKYSGSVYCVEVPSHVVYVRRGGKAFWCSQTYPDLFSTTIKDWLDLFGDLGHFKQGSKEPPTHYLDYELEDGTIVKSEAIFLALDRPDHVKKLRGAQATWFWLNEVKELMKPVVDMADLRHGRYPSKMDGGPTWHGMIGDTNAPDDSHWYYMLAEEDKPEDWEFFRQPGGLMKVADGVYQENPEAENVNNLPEGYYIKGRQGKSADWIDVNLCNEYGSVITGKPVHPEYVDSVHCADAVIEYDPKLPLIIGHDFGRTPAAAILQKNAMRYVAIDEFVTQNMSAAVYGPNLKIYLDTFYPGCTVEGWGDPAGDAKGQATDDTPILVLNASGIPCSPTFTNKTIIRRAAVANPLTRLAMDGKPALLISPKCKIIRKGLKGGFCYRRLQIGGTEQYTEEPDKNDYSHPVEALEYALVGAGEGQEAIAPPTTKKVTRRARNWKTA